MIGKILFVVNKSFTELNERLAQIETLIQKPGCDREWYSVEELAKQLGKATFTVREWCRLRRIHAEKRNSGRGPHAAWVVSHKELDRLQREGLLPQPGF